MKVVCGLGNPGPEYEITRHNVGWWAVDRAVREWHFGRYRRQGIALAAEGTMGDEQVRVLKPLTYMNLSGTALLPLLREPHFNFTTDVLVVVDDTALPIGRLRFRPAGSAGGHNGLKSIELVLQSREYARLRIGIGAKPLGVPLADHVLSSFEPTEEARVLEVLPDAVEGMRSWVCEGVESAMDKFNR